MRIFLKLVALVAGIFSVHGATVSYTPSLVVPPKPSREFRAAWVPCVGENSWLLFAGTNTALQKATLIAMLDRAVELKLNAIILQVRPACDALYASKIEPWSEQLTGTMGKAPWPYYDPLAFVIEEAHKRGLELHAWFNPYRALHQSAIPRISLNHIVRQRPDLVRSYGENFWLDPGERDVQDHSVAVVMDVVRRYDIDGVHFDDYFYPYQIKDSAGRVLDFPDNASWKKFGANGKLKRDDWRRENVNGLIQRVYNSIKAAKPWVQFGISPFGIWQTGSPPQIKGLDAYGTIYADSRKWLVNGWADYFAPQLYWPINEYEHSFPVLLKWWAEQNVAGRVLLAGISTAALPQETILQIDISRRQANVSGHIHWNMSSLLRNPALMTQLRQTIYTEPALVPFSTRALAFETKPPAKPLVVARNKRFERSTRINWSSPVNQTVEHWVLQFKNGDEWTTEILTANQTSRVFVGDLPQVVAVTGVNRFGVLSLPTVIALKKK